MARRGSRRRLATNIYADRTGIAAIVRWRQYTEELRFPHGTPVPEIRREMQSRQDELSEQAPAAKLGTVRQAVEKYLETLPDGEYRKDRTWLLGAWTAAVGDEMLGALKRARLVEVIEDWQRAGHSSSRINKRISALRVLWRRIAPDHALPHAVERLARARDTSAQLDRARDMTLVQRVLDNLSDDGRADKDTNRGGPSLTRARLWALAWTGLPPSLLRQVKPEHVRWTADPPELYVQPRRKGKGVDAAWVALLPQGVAALKHLFAIGAAGGVWGKTPRHRAWRAAVKTTQADLRKEGRDEDAARLEGMRPYDLRHSLLTALGTISGDIYAVAELARHSDLRTTRRYMRGAASARVRVAVTALATAMLVPRTGATSGGEKRREGRRASRSLRKPTAGRRRKSGPE